MYGQLEQYKLLHVNESCAPTGAVPAFFLTMTTQPSLSLDLNTWLRSIMHAWDLRAKEDYETDGEPRGEPKPHLRLPEDEEVDPVTLQPLKEEDPRARRERFAHCLAPRRLPLLFLNN